MPIWDIVLLVFAGVIGGGANAIAGGGTFFTFPALVATGLDPLTANVSNAVAVYPGHAAAIPAYRAELRSVGRSLIPRCLIAAAGGMVGAGLLLWVGGATFTVLVPYLILTATLLFAFAPLIRTFAERARSDSRFTNGSIEFVFAIYGGYFGAGLGVLLMAALTIVGVRDLQLANAQKNLIATIITTISVTIFIVAGAVAWAHTACVLAGALVGGYLGGRLARKIPEIVLRVVIIATGLGVSLYYFLRLYG